MSGVGSPTSRSLVGNASARADYSFGAFVYDLGCVIRSVGDEQEIVHRVRNMLADALRCDEFVLDCIDRATSTITDSLGSWVNPPIFDDDSIACSVRLIFWPRNYSNQPHEHTFWTVTGVLFNELTFTTYRRDVASMRLGFSVDKTFSGKRGEVGYILPPCIHSVGNQSLSSSISIHVFSGPKASAGSGISVPHERGRTIWHEVDGLAAMSEGSSIGDAIGALIMVLDSIPGQRTLGLLDRIFVAGGLQTKLACAKAIGRQDPTRAAERLNDLGALCSEVDRVRLRVLADALVGLPKED
jgi:predicted metal-dependent enzyme (double-stranded beta helix superfamily)